MRPRSVRGNNTSERVGQDGPITITCQSAGAHILIGVTSHCYIASKIWQWLWRPQKSTKEKHRRGKGRCTDIWWSKYGGVCSKGIFFINLQFGHIRIWCMMLLVTLIWTKSPQEAMESSFQLQKHQLELHKPQKEIISDRSSLLFFLNIPQSKKNMHMSGDLNRTILTSINCEQFVT